MRISDLVYIDSTGYHFTDYPTFLAWIQDQYRAIYGADVYLEADSQDGQFLAVLAQAFYDTAALGASVFNSFSPATAQGVGLSRVVKINGIARQAPSKSTAELTIVGVAGTVITGGVAIDTLQQKWDVPTTTIPGGGSITVTGVAQLEGAINAAAHTITTIFTPTRGWQTVDNAAAATAGAPVETDAELRIRQTQSVADPSLTVFDGTVGGVENVTGVQKVQGYENDTDSLDITTTIPAHSISLVVLGGDDTAIAEEILLHKTPGTGTFGGTSVSLFDAHGMPITIKFQRPVTATISAQITIVTGEGWSADYADLIKAAVADFLNSGKIGGQIVYTKLFKIAYLNGTAPGETYDVTGIQIEKNSGGFSAANIDLDWDENPVCTTANVTIL